MKKISEFPNIGMSGSKRTNLEHCDYVHGDSKGQTFDWFIGYGKSRGCEFEGTWWDMICFARNVLANENTKLVAPEFYKPELKNDNYTGQLIPYEFELTKVKKNNEE